METATTHEARARNAKAFALAQVLFDHGAAVANVAVLPPAGWSMVATLATQAELLGRTTIGKVRIVHVPGSDATVAAVARILGDLIAAANDAAAIAELNEAESACCPAGERNVCCYPETFPAPTPDEQAEVDRWLATADEIRPRNALDPSEARPPTDDSIVFKTVPSTSQNPAGVAERATVRMLDEPQADVVFCPHGTAAPHSPDGQTCNGCGRPLKPGQKRRPTDSQGYREVVGQLDPTTAQAFNAFGQAAR